MSRWLLLCWLKAGVMVYVWSYHVYTNSPMFQCFSTFALAFIWFCTALVLTVREYYQ